MIKFFRNIRQRLLTENRINRYLLYAIGEIFLVVIGILIALQINDWNDQRKAQIKEDNFFDNVLIDLEKDQEKINFYKKFHTKRIEYLDTLLTYVRNPNKVMGIDKFGRYVEPLFYSVNPTQNSTTFESAKSSGIFNSFSEKEILKNLSLYYAEFEFVKYAFDSILRFIENHFEPLMYTLPESYMNTETGSLVINEVSVQEFYDKIASIKDYRGINPDYNKILTTPKMENYLIGDMGRTFNALGKLVSREKQLQELKDQILNK